MTVTKAIHPNVLLLMVDQMRTPRWFPPDATLPAYERLKREALFFEHSYVSANPCSPSRATIFTGLHYTQHGIHSNVGVNPFAPGIGSLDPRWPTLAHVFRRAGYRTPYVGKWHLSTEADYKDVGLRRYGFEEWSGPDHEGVPLEGLHEDGGFAEAAIAWLQRHAQRGPWLLTCSFINPHDIMFYRRTQPPDDCAAVCDALPANHHDDLATKPRVQAQYQRFWGRVMGMSPDQSEAAWRRYGDFYFYLTRKVDAEVGRVLDALETSGVAADTLTVFVSDHGEMAGAHKLQGKGPFVYQENVQVPLMFRWPGKVAPGVVTTALTHNVDLFPTLVDLAGVGPAPAHLPGKSLAGVVRGGIEPVNDHVILSWGMTASRAPANPSAPTGPRRAGAPGEVHGIFDGRYKFARYFDEGGAEQELELYDLGNDPFELTNLAGDAGSASRCREMADRLRFAEQGAMAAIGLDRLPSR